MPLQSIQKELVPRSPSCRIFGGRGLPRSASASRATQKQAVRRRLNWQPLLLTRSSFPLVRRGPSFIRRRHYFEKRDSSRSLLILMSHDTIVRHKDALIVSIRPYKTPENDSRFSSHCVKNPRNANGNGCPSLFTPFILERRKDFAGRRWLFREIDYWLEVGPQPPAGMG